MVISLTAREKMKPANMGPAGKFLNIRQGDQSIEDYAEYFVRMARQSVTEKTCLMVIFWGGLADPFKSMMPYCAPEESLEEYVNLALHLSGSAFRVEAAPESAPFCEPTESAPALPALPCLLLCLPHPGPCDCLCLQALFHYMGLAPYFLFYKIFL